MSALFFSYGLGLLSKYKYFVILLSSYFIFGISKTLQHLTLYYFSKNLRCQYLQTLSFHS